MSLIIVEVAPDAEFNAELRALDRSNDWKLWAVSGRMVGKLREGFASDPRPVHPMERSYVGPAEDRRAWLWGFHWKPGGPPPVERPLGECPECWRLGEACEAHYRGGW